MDISKKERRKTAHLTEKFKEYNRKELSKVLGIELDERQAFTIFKIAHKIPMRFIAQHIGPEDLDGRGEKAISVPGIGKFKFRITKPQGKNVVTLPDGGYPRYKFYPARAIEVEVENLHGIADKESREAYEKYMKSEEKHVERTAKEISRKISKYLEGKGEVVNVSNLSLDEIIKEIVREEIKKSLRNEKIKENPKKEDVKDENEDLDELNEFDDIEDDVDEEEEVVIENPTTGPIKGTAEEKALFDDFDDFEFDFDS